MKAFATVSNGLDELDTFTVLGDSIEDASRNVESALIRFNVHCDFAYTVYNAPKGIQVPVSSRRGHVSDIIADMVAERA
jgi:hypothetical protein